MSEILTQSTVRVAIYARYSCEQQRETSIEDQVRRCKEIVEYLGMQVSEWLIFTDSAMSGQGYAQDKRAGLRALEQAWHKNAFDILMLDGFERLTRDGVQQEKYLKLLKENRRIRLITADGIDTKREGWDLLLRLKGAIAQAEISGLQHRVSRGMVGQLERGFMIATPAFGYDIKREFDALGNQIGSRWEINPQEADWVRQIFDRRKAGQSMRQIAQWLNDLGVAITRKARTSDGGYWRPSRIRNLLSNPIYRGEFVWHGSTTFRARAEKRGDDVKERRYSRPELRLVSDEVWTLCNTKTGRRSGYGGGKHALAGLFSCGCCGGTLVLSSKSSRQSIYCANCTIAKSCSNSQIARLTVTVATSGVKTLLTEVLKFFLTPDFVKAFRQSLNDKLTAGNRHEHDSCEKELKRLQRSQARLAHMLASIDGDDAILQTQYEETRRLAREAEARLAILVTEQVDIDHQAAAAQLDIDPATVLAGLFEAGLPPEQLREMLRRLFPSLVLEGKESTHRAIFRVQFSGGAALALASNTESQIDESFECRFMLSYVAGKRKDNSSCWTVTALDREWVNLLGASSPAEA